MSRGRSFGETIPDALAFLVPFLLLAGLALSGGGYDLFARHLAGILAWVLVAVLLLGPWRDQFRPGRRFAVIGGLILALALLSGISSIWSHSVSASIGEFERVLGYLGFFTASYLTCRTPKQREWCARGIGTGIAVIAVLALGERLLPGESSSGAGFFAARLSYPLGYWNADGVVFGIGAVLFTWFASTAERLRWRSAAIALSTLTATALYLTYSRGGLLAATISLVLLFFLTPIRLRFIATAVVAVAAAVPILITFARIPAISGDDLGSPSTGESLIALVVILISLGLAGLLLEAVLRLARRNPRPIGRLVEISRDRRVLLSLAGTGIALFVLLTIAYGSQAWDQFSESDVPKPASGKERFTDLSGAYRYEFNQVALDTFVDKPLTGSGAGTFVFEWTREREDQVSSRNAHSFYVESLSELGVTGGLIAVGLAFSLIAFGLVAWRRQQGRDAPAIVALVTGLLVAFAFDWFWQLGVTAGLLLLLAAWIASGESVDPGREARKAGAGFRIAGLLLAWIAVVALGTSAVADRYTEASADSVRAGKLQKAVDQAETASQLEPWAPEPYLQLGTIAEGQGDLPGALNQYDKAIDLEPDNWRAVLLRFRANYNAGRLEEARRDFERLKELNPVYFEPYSFDRISQLLS